VAEAVQDLQAQLAQTDPQADQEVVAEVVDQQELEHNLVKIREYLESYNGDIQANQTDQVLEAAVLDKRAALEDRALVAMV
jgi:cellobiose phosphorylase